MKLIEIDRPKDAGVREDCVRVVRTTIESLGGLDVVISNAVSTEEEEEEHYLQAFTRTCPGLFSPYFLLFFLAIY